MWTSVQICLIIDDIHKTYSIQLFLFLEKNIEFIPQFRAGPEVFVTETNASFGLMLAWLCNISCFENNPEFYCIVSYMSDKVVDFTLYKIILNGIIWLNKAIELTSTSV